MAQLHRLPMGSFAFISFLLSAFSVLEPVLASGSLGSLPVTAFDEGYTHLFGDDNLVVYRDGKSVLLSLDERTGSGFVSQDIYLHGFFSASIKLPADYTAGVVVAFYMSNGDMFEKNHDEIDFEFLGNIRGKEWRIQTNVYGNGSTSVGREERYGLWFDPSDDYHQYSILWTDSLILFYIDGLPIREVKRMKAMRRAFFPSKPMSLYATIWDGSDWATNGGKYRVNYKYSPYIVQFTDLVLRGCAVDPIEKVSSVCEDAYPAGLTEDERITMGSMRKKHMTYSYCYDRTRYRIPPAECVISPGEAERLRRFDPVTFGSRSGGKRYRKTGRHMIQGSRADASS
ncbi:hypothetical protein SAY87_027764 [Trapa incisa]|uniref:Xyloglucan endotransglucosylase/hydrolase n=1 Tax=Trapa incisa TaxID=236973 RepID=A0AAN7JMZ4_9MYRT|nr:hypothetical protein SAY87_027764 [Trapa incisa]